MRRFLVALVGQRYRVAAVADGNAALAAIDERLPDLLLADVMMPGMGALELVRTLRATPDLSNLPIILLSARVDIELRVAGLAAGADDFLTKPFENKELLARISAQLESSWKRAQREQALRLEAEAVQERLQEVLSSINDAFIAFDRNWHITYINAKAAALLSMHPTELQGRPIWELFPADGQDLLARQARQAMDTGVEAHFEYFYGALKRWCDVRLFPSPHGLTLLATDITKRKVAEAAQRRLSKVFMDSADPIVIEDLDRRIIATNRAVEEAYGWSREELVGRPVYALIAPWTYHQEDAMVEACLRGENMRNVEAARWHRDGYMIPSLVTFSLLTDERGQPTGIATIAKDISNLKEAEHALRASEEKFAKAFRSSPDAIFLAKLPGGEIVEVNDGFQQVTGYTEGEALGHTTVELGLVAKPNERRRLLTQLAAEGRLRNQEIVLIAKSGERRICMVSAEPFPLGEEQYVVTVFRDITEHRRDEEALHLTIEELQLVNRDLQNAEERLREQNQTLVESRVALDNERQRYLELFQFAPDGYIVTELDGRITEINHAARHQLAPSEETSFLGKPLGSFISAEERPEFAALLHPLRQGKQQKTAMEVRLDHDTSAPFDALLTVTIAQDAEGQPVGLRWLIRDISERKLTERRQHLLMHLNQRLRELHDPRAMMWEAVSQLANHFAVNCAAYEEVDEANEYRLVRRLWCASVKSMIGTHRLDELGDTIVAELKQGHTVVINDALTDARTGGKTLELFPPFESRTILIVPLLKQGRLAALSSLHDHQAYQWSEGEILFVQQVIEHARLAAANEEAQRALRESEERRRLAMTGAKLGYWDWDLLSDTIVWSREHNRLVGLPEEESLGSYDRFMERVHPEDQEELAEALELSLAQRTPFQAEFRVIHPVGSIHWMHGTGRTYYNQQGMPTRMIGILRDITQRKQAEIERQQLYEEMQAAYENLADKQARLDFLVDASGTLLTNSLDYATTLESIVRLAVPLLADWCYIEVPQAQGTLLSIALAYHDPSMQELAQAWKNIQIPKTAAHYPAIKVLQNSEPQWIEPVESSFLNTIATSGTHRTLLHQLAPLSWITVPLKSQQRTLGAITFLSTQPERRYEQDDVAFIEDLAQRAAIAVNNAQLYREARQRLAQAREAERRHFARELHDDVLQKLIGLRYHLAQHRLVTKHQRFAQEPEITQLGSILDTIESEMLGVVQMLRGVISTLRPAGLEELGLTQALEGYIAQTERKMGPKRPEIVLNIADLPGNLPTPIALFLYRMVQEALHNVMKHAEAGQVDINMSFTEEEVGLCIHDDGRGFELPEPLGALAQQGRFGLVGLQEQVELLNGELTISSSPEDGTRLSARIPINSSAEEHHAP